MAIELATRAEHEGETLSREQQELAAIATAEQLYRHDSNIMFDGRPEVMRLPVSKFFAVQAWIIIR